MMKNYLTLSLCVTLAGCLSTTDLLRDDAKLNSSQRTIVKEIAEKTKNLCITYTYDLGSGAKLSGDMKITKTPAVKKFYTSETGWYKIYFMLNGVWDYSFYNPNEFRFICGEKQWEKYRDAKSIVFDEVNAELKSFEQSPSIPIQPKSQSIEDKLRNLQELRQKNLITEKQHDKLVKRLFN